LRRRRVRLFFCSVVLVIVDVYDLEGGLFEVVDIHDDENDGAEE
jgi:hypothetical protein